MKRKANGRWGMSQTVIKRALMKRAVVRRAPIKRTVVKRTVVRSQAAKLRGPLVRVLVCLQLLAAPAQFALRVGAAAGRQTGPGGVLAEEAREARELAAAFSERLLRARDLAPLVREMYVGDFARRYVEHQASGGERGPSHDFMFGGVPSLRFKPALLAHAESELWPRLYVAANNLLHYGFISLMARGGPDADKLEEQVRAVYPPAVAEMFGRNPSLANFIVRKGDAVPVGTTEELRDVVSKMEEAARLTRESLDGRLPLDASKLESNLGELRRVAASMGVRAVPTGGRAFMGYPAGTRFLSVLTPVGLNLLLVREGGRMKVVWASTVRD